MLLFLNGCLYILNNDYHILALTLQMTLGIVSSSVSNSTTPACSDGNAQRFDLDRLDKSFYYS